MSSRQSLLDYSLTQLYREAERHRPTEAGSSNPQAETADGVAPLGLPSETTD
jgi:hypothetical protein